MGLHQPLTFQLWKLTLSSGEVVGSINFVSQKRGERRKLKVPGQFYPLAAKKKRAKTVWGLVATPHLFGEVGLILWGNGLFTGKLRAVSRWEKLKLENLGRAIYMKSVRIALPFNIEIQ